MVCDSDYILVKIISRFCLTLYLLFPLIQIKVALIEGLENHVMVTLPFALIKISGKLEKILSKNTEMKSHINFRHQWKTFYKQANLDFWQGQGRI